MTDSPLEAWNFGHSPPRARVRHVAHLDPESLIGKPVRVRVNSLHLRGKVRFYSGTLARFLFRCIDADTGDPVFVVTPGGNRNENQD